MSTLPPRLKALGHYIKIANEHSSRDPVVYYWCLVYTVQTGMSIDKKSPECVQYLSGLLNTLEEVKKSLAGSEAVTNDIVAHAHLEQYALKLFVHADNEDRAAHFDKNVVKAFYTAGHLMDVLTLFGEMDERVEENRKYAKWKAAYIHNCLRTGQTPEPGPVGWEGAAGEQGEMGFNVPTGPVSGQFADAAATSGEPSYNPQPPQQPAPVPAESPSAAGGLSAADSSQAQKHCKYAISALEYDDLPTAIDNLQQALQLLHA